MRPRAARESGAMVWAAGALGLAAVVGAVAEVLAMTAPLLPGLAA